MRGEGGDWNKRDKKQETADQEASFAVETSELVSESLRENATARRIVEEQREERPRKVKITHTRGAHLQSPPPQAHLLLMKLG